MFLSNEELQELTGYKRTAFQIRWLLKNKVAYTLTGGGVPKVSKSAIEIMLGVTPHKNMMSAQPNWAALGV